MYKGWTTLWTHAGVTSRVQRFISASCRTARTLKLPDSSDSANQSYDRHIPLHSNKSLLARPKHSSFMALFTPLVARPEARQSARISSKFTPKGDFASPCKLVELAALSDDALNVDRSHMTVSFIRNRPRCSPSAFVYVLMLLCRPRAAATHLHCAASSSPPSLA